MKIAILSCFHPYRGGISQFNTFLYNELGKENDVKAFNFKRQYPDILFPGKTQYVSDKDKTVSIQSEPLLDTVNPFSFITTLRAIRRWEPDLLIVRYWMSWFAPSLGFITRRMRKRCTVISILDNVIPHEPHFFDAPLTKYFLKGSDGSVTLCDAVAEDLKKLSPATRYEVIPHPLYTQFGPARDRYASEEKLGLEHGRKNILFFGLIREYKGLDILLEAFEGLGDEYQLIVAGEPYGSFDKYSQIIGRSMAKDRIRLFLQFIDDDDVADYFSAADVVVLPYRNATQSGISAISYHFEVPLIVTDTGGLQEMIGDRGTGLVAKECTREAVLEEMKRFFSDPEIKASCIENIKKEKERLSWNSFCRRLTEFASGLKQM